MNRRHIWTIAAIGLLVTAAVWWPHTKAASQAPASSGSESARPDPEAKLARKGDGKEAKRTCCAVAFSRGATDARSVG